VELDLVECTCVDGNARFNLRGGWIDGFLTHLVGVPAIGEFIDRRAIAVRLKRYCYNVCLKHQKGAQRMSVRSTIAMQFEQVAVEQKRKLARLSDDLKLLDSGLDSLSFALIVARLEDALGFDPFDVAEDIKFPVTFGDFVRLYEKQPN
jgi:acyl carrier protein